jgi:hypothetical protein
VGQRGVRKILYFSIIYSIFSNFVKNRILYCIIRIVHSILNNCILYHTCRGAMGLRMD